MPPLVFGYVRASNVVDAATYVDRLQRAAVCEGMVLVDVFVERDSSHTAFFAMLDRLCFDEAEGVLVLAEQHWDDEFRMLAAQFIDDSGAWLYVVREVEHSS